MADHTRKSAHHEYISIHGGLCGCQHAVKPTQKDEVNLPPTRTPRPRCSVKSILESFVLSSHNPGTSVEHCEIEPQLRTRVPNIYDNTDAVVQVTTCASKRIKS